MWLGHNVCNLCLKIVWLIREPLLIHTTTFGTLWLLKTIILKTLKIIKVFVGIQTATLWISYGHPVRNKCPGFSFELHFTIILFTVIWMYRIITDPKNWMSSKSLWEFLLILYWLPYWLPYFLEKLILQTRRAQEN